ncbi:MAG TPA: PDZ domain-containing protein [Flavobacteriales bacterium]|nr:PDZ domain-containing protein [Flavobacteriales bacterium]
MNTHLLVRGFGALLLANLGTLVSAQQEAEGTGKGEEQRRIRIEISKNENGHVTHETREFDLNNEAELHEALRELGVLDELSRIGDGENVTFDLRRRSDTGLLNDMCVALAWPDVDDAFKAPEPRPYLGVYYEDWSPSSDKSARKEEPPIKEGTAVTGVDEGSAADKAGIRSGDVIVDIGGKAIGHGDGLVEAIESYQPGEKVKVTYYRGKQKKSAEVELGSRVDPEETDWTQVPFITNSTEWDWDQYFGDNGETDNGAFLGVEGGSDADKGVRIGAVVERSAAEKMGVKEGDIVRSINGEDLEDFSDLADQIGSMNAGDEVELGIVRDGKEMTLNGQMGGQERARGRSYNFSMPTPPTPPTPPSPPSPAYEGYPGYEGYQGYRMDPDEIRARADEARARAEEARSRADEMRSRADEMRAQMDELRQEMDRLRRDLRGGVTREMHVDISADVIEQKDLDLLKGKGVKGLEAPLELVAMETYPEPGGDSFHIAFQVPARGDLAVDLHNASGERVYHETISGFKGNYERTLDVSDQADGTYFLVITQNGHSTARKLVKK